MGVVSTLWDVVTYNAFPPGIDGLGLDVLLFLLLASAVAAMPMVINNIPVFLIQWVSLAVFLSFGLFVEMVAFPNEYIDVFYYFTCNWFCLLFTWWRNRQELTS